MTNFFFGKQLNVDWIVVVSKKNKLKWIEEYVKQNKQRNPERERYAVTIRIKSGIAYNIIHNGDKSNMIYFVTIFE